MSEATAERMEIVNGPKRAVFVRDENGWKPDWFYEGERPMLRFKDHEWLSIGHVHPRTAGEARKIRGGGALFQGVDKYGTVEVAWSVRIERDKGSEGFVIETTMQPAESIELLEAHTSFETPYEYDGSEHATTIIGMNPTVRWEGTNLLSPPVIKRPEWVYGRNQAARLTAPCNAPYACHTLANADGSNARYTTVVGDWNVCRIREVYVTPTRNTKIDVPDVFSHAGEKRGYKFIMGAFNWNSAYFKDPNVLFKGKTKHRQRVVVDFASTIPGGSLDQMILAGWQRAAAFDLPADGRVAAYDRVVSRGVTWPAATRWLRDVFCGSGTPGLFHPDKGIPTYAVGTRPKAGGDGSWYWWPQWAGLLHYRAMVLGDEELAAKARQFDVKFAEHAKSQSYYGKSTAVSITMLPSIWWIYGPGRDGILKAAFEPLLRKAMEISAAENGQPRRMDFGFQAALAESLLLASEIYHEPAMKQQGLMLLSELNAELDNRIWAFNVSVAGSMVHGGQARPHGHAHAALANLLAARLTGDQKHRTAAQRFARYLLALQYASHNGSADPDFDWRGWANGSNAGRDQVAEFPPWETANSLLCLAGLMDEIDLESGFHDALWYFAHTGLAQFPAARTLKRIFDQNYRVQYLPREQITSERDFYDILPYLAYENPLDQTLLASYQGTDCLLVELAFAGALAKASDDRLSVVVPQAALMDAEVLKRRQVLVWNPTGEAIESDVTVMWPDGQVASQHVTAPSRQATKLVFQR